MEASVPYSFLWGRFYTWSGYSPESEGSREWCRRIYPGEREQRQGAGYPDCGTGWRQVSDWGLQGRQKRWWAIGLRLKLKLCALSWIGSRCLIHLIQDLGHCFWSVNCPFERRFLTFLLSGHSTKIFSAYWSFSQMSVQFLCLSFHFET